MAQHERSSRMAALLFTDMVDSVGLQGRIGTESYARLLRAHHQLFRTVLDHVPCGRIRNDTGDGILCEFDTAAGAVNAALLFQLLLREERWEKEAPRVRMGIAQGQLAEIELEDSDGAKMVGMPLNIAARVMSAAQGRQILLTRPVYEDAHQFVLEHPVFPVMFLAPPVIRWENHGPYKTKGSDDVIEIFEVGAVGFAPFTSPGNTEKIGPSGHSEGKMPISRPAMKGAALAIFCGLLAWATILGDPFERASYDYLFLMPRQTTNKLALVMVDEASGRQFHQRRNEWDRKFYTQLLNKLTDDGVSLVAFDLFFERTNDINGDEALAAAMRRHGHVILGARVIEEDDKVISPPISAQSGLNPLFQNAAFAWGFGNAGVLELGTPRWEPFISASESPTLPVVAAKASGIDVPNFRERRWLRYYGEQPAWLKHTFAHALNRPARYFEGKIVFVGSEPERLNNPLFVEKDKFCTPHTRWTERAVGGVEILATEYLNLVNDDWLRRAPWWTELFILIMVGAALGAGQANVRRRTACAISMIVMASVSLGGIFLSFYTNYWFPWLFIVAVQAPCALIWAFICGRARQQRQLPAATAMTKPAAASSPIPAF